MFFSMLFIGPKDISSAPNYEKFHCGYLDDTSARQA